MAIDDRARAAHHRGEHKDSGGARVGRASRHHPGNQPHGGVVLRPVTPTIARPSPPRMRKRDVLSRCMFQRTGRSITF